MMMAVTASAQVAPTDQMISAKLTAFPRPKLVQQSYKTTGRPTEALGTPDGKYVLVTVDVPGGSGIDVFRDSGETLERVAFQRLGPERAHGIVLLPKTRTLAVGLSNAGVAFLPLDDVLLGTAKLKVLPQGDRAGSGYLAATPDGRFLFVANEYGEGGNLGVIALNPDDTGELHPRMLAHIRTPNTVEGLAISADGTRLYTAGEVVSPDSAGKLPGHRNAEQGRKTCAQGIGEASLPNGALYAIDVAKATTLEKGSTAEQARAAVVAVVDAGCSPVGEAVSANGAAVYVTARGDDRVLVFNAKTLEKNPGHALMHAFAAEGAAPAGLLLFDGGKSLLVANSNRFVDGPGSLAVFDLSDAGKPVLRESIETGKLPRRITASADGETLYLTVFSGNELMVLRAQ